MSSGDNYTGDWYLDLYHGTGTYTYVNGDVYKGLYIYMIKFSSYHINYSFINLKCILNNCFFHIKEITKMENKMDKEFIKDTMGVSIVLFILKLI
jgi:hypothetical protein